MFQNGLGIVRVLIRVVLPKYVQFAGFRNVDKFAMEYQSKSSFSAISITDSSCSSSK